MLNESIKMALQGMVSNKLRTFLTLLGIIIGVGAVIAMVSLGFGLKENVKNNISKLGSNLLIITSGGRTASGARLAAGEGVKLTYDDMQAIEKQVDGIANISASVNRSYQMVAGNQNWTSRVEGTTPSNFTISSLEVEDGRVLNERDLVSRGRVAVIGKTVADSLFPEGNPVGKIMRINKAPFQVIGVLKSKGQGSMGMDQDDVVYVPLTTAQNRMMWALLTIMADHYNGGRTGGVTPEDCYLEMLEKYGAKVDYLEVPAGALDILRGCYRLVHLVEILDNNRCTVKCTQGSSTFTTQEMKNMIEGIFDRLAEMGVSDPLVTAYWQEWSEP